MQLYGRVWFHASRPNIDPGPAPLRRQPSGAWVHPCRRKPSLIGPRKFHFLNCLGDLDCDGWDNPRRDKLWRYNQHYFDDLNAQDAAARSSCHAALLTEWCASNPVGEGTAWEPYPTSLRIVNWIKWALAGNQHQASITDSLALQARWLARRLEWHLLGNHLFANAKALIFAGLWFEGREAQSWLDKGFRILERETEEQILPDGGQFELSPMYHALALEDVLDLVNVCSAFDSALTQAQRTLRDRWRALVPVMNRWLDALSHPDGEIAFFNDAAIGIAPSRLELNAYCRRLDIGEPGVLQSVISFPQTGYVRLSTPDAVLIADLARVGPDYLPGHAHADTLSFEFSLFGRRVFVNSGTSVYGTDVERQRQRGTAAHNTVVIDDQNSSDVWSGFRVGRRARPFDIASGQDGDVRFAEGSHCGYRHLPGQPIHTRRWELSPKTFRVIDRVSARQSSAFARFHLHPDVALTQYNETGGKLVFNDGRRVLWRAKSGPAQIEQTTWHPEFGKSVANTCLVLPLTDGDAVFDLTWATE